MAYPHNFVIEPARQVASLIDEAVNIFRNRGMTREQAIEQAALALDVRANRAKAILYGKLFSVTTEERLAAKRRFAALLDNEADDLARRREAALARRRQMEIDL